VNYRKNRITYYFEIFQFILFYLPFAFFLALGPFPIYFFSISIENISSLLVGISLAALLLSRRSQQNSRKISTNYVLLFFYLSLMPSVLFSSNLDLSASRFFIFSAYFLLFAISININYSLYFYKKIYYISLLSLVIVCLLIIYLYFFSDYSETVRFALASNFDDYANEGQFAESGAVDPNMTAIGLVLTFALCIPGIKTSDNFRFRNFKLVCISCLLLIALWCLQSRTGLIAYSLILVFVHFGKLSKFLTVKVLLFLFVFLIILVSFAILAAGDTAEYWARFDLKYILQYESEPGGRIDHINRSFSDILTSGKSLILGVGFFTSNPHNEFLRIFRDSGILSGLIFIFFLIIFYLNLKRDAIRLHAKSNFLNASFFPLLFMLTTYGHTKTLWAGLVFSYIVSQVDFYKIENL